MYMFEISLKEHAVCAFHYDHNYSSKLCYNFTELTALCFWRVKFSLFLGDYVLLGKTNMFRFNNPAEAAKLRERRQVQILVYDCTTLFTSGLKINECALLHKFQCHRKGYLFQILSLSLLNV